MPNTVPFSRRHVGPAPHQFDQMLSFLKVDSLETLIKETVPEGILKPEALQLPEALSEPELLERARELAKKNKLFRSFIGMGYYGTHTPAVIMRSILENPCWYTAYTPYQPEISQGRLEALINFQTMVTDLTGMEIANASLLDEGTAIAEAVNMAHAITRRKKHKVAVVGAVFPQSLSVLKTRCEPLGIEVVQATAEDLPWDDIFAIVQQYPDAKGHIPNLEPVIEKAHNNGALSIVSADIMSLLLLKAPGEMGADIVVGSTQRFGVPMGFGGPHAAYLATRDKHKRLIPGRIVGASKDNKERPAYRLALQTREQHIRREKATSNICTSQVLLAVVAGMYAVFHGPRRLKQIAKDIHNKTTTLKVGLESFGFKIENQNYFDTLTVSVSESKKEKIRTRCLGEEINLNFYNPGEISISLDEVTRDSDVTDLLTVFADGKALPESSSVTTGELAGVPSPLRRESAYLTHPVFHRFRSETDLLRYITRLQRKDLTLADAMIPLGSCTMKLNAAAELEPITWPEFANLHPFAPSDQTIGFTELIDELEKDLCEITGFAGISLQPNAGSQGEYAGLRAIDLYHKSNGHHHRNICLIPSSAHGTNPASAVMAGMKVAIVACDENGNIDVNDLKAKAEEHSENLAALMVTYPSTHGVFEEAIQEICQVVHSHGGQVYMDGANLNAMVGLCYPGQFGPDVSHLNLHKTFCIPHGGGGPGVGPVAVRAHLKPFLPTHNLNAMAGPKTGVQNISAAPWGSALILPISWAFVRLMGAKGLQLSTETAILNANYIAEKIQDHFPVLYRGANGRVAHECIIDVRPLKASSGVDVNDIAKRLMDYGFHAPTMSWPVVNTLMIEPTESESQEELDRFCEAMIQIRKEVEKIEKGEWDKENNPLKLAPHTTQDLLENWDRPYSKKEAFFPLPWVEEKKFWVPVNRIDNAYGDRNLFCSCLPVDEYGTTAGEPVQKLGEKNPGKGPTSGGASGSDSVSPNVSVKPSSSMTSNITQ